tara:strand:+ start:7272 stop:8126 length:855 start_codon:yes stop_codon:yes gene_type:complete
MKILVTGGLGFVGSNLVDKLVLDNNTVYVIDNLSSISSSDSYKNPKAKYYIKDIRDVMSIKDFPKFDIIYHLAGLARIQPSFSEPLEYLDVNIMGTSIICQLAYKYNSKLVYASSSSINNGEYKTPYTFSKWGGEEALQTWIECYDIDALICRFYNVYGPREPKIGDYATVIRKFLRQYEEKKPLTIVGDGEQRRDFTHVSDIVNGLIAASSHNNPGKVLHLGRGKNYSINQVVKMFTGSKFVHLPNRLGEGNITLADYEETFSLLSWRAVKELEDYIKNIIKS